MRKVKKQHSSKFGTLRIALIRVMNSLTFSSLLRLLIKRYIDPSYMIRSVPANATDTLYCMQRK